MAYRPLHELRTRPTTVASSSVPVGRSQYACRIRLCRLLDEVKLSRVSLDTQIRNRYKPFDSPESISELARLPRIVKLLRRLPFFDFSVLISLFR